MSLAPWDRCLLRVRDLRSARRRRRSPDRPLGPQLIENAATAFAQRHLRRATGCLLAGRCAAAIDERRRVTAEAGEPRQRQALSLIHI